MESLDIDKIKVPLYRTIMGDDDLTNLAEDIGERGILVRLLVNQEYELIDGLRRYAAAQKIGLKQVPVVVATSLEEAASALDVAHKPHPLSRPLTALRVWEIIQGTDPYMWQKRKEYGQATKGAKKVARGEKTPGYKPVTNPSRHLLANALGGRKPSYLQSIRFVFNTAAQPGPWQQRALFWRDKVVCEGVSAYSAYNHFREERKQAQYGVSWQVQRDVLTSLPSVLAPIHKSLEGLGLIRPEISLEMAELALQNIRKVNSDLYTVSRNLRTYIRTKETDNNE